MKLRRALAKTVSWPLFILHFAGSLVFQFVAYRFTRRAIRPRLAAADRPATSV